MDYRPIISVITVCYNAAKSLERTILSVIGQTFSDFEYIIVDGGSTDESKDVILRYLSNIDKWISESDKGIYDAMNKGLMMASGKWVLFMNAGDVFTDNLVLKQVFETDIDDNIEFLYSDYWQLSTGGEELIYHHTNRDKGVVHHQSSIYKKELHKQYGLYLTERPYSAYDLLFFLSVPKEKFLKLPLPIATIESGGVSDGCWIWERSEALRVMFGLKSIHHAYFTYLIKVCKYKLPYRFRRFVGKHILGHASKKYHDIHSDGNL